MLMVPLITKASVKTHPSKDTWINESQSPGSSCSFKSVTTLISMTSGANSNDLVHYTMLCQKTLGHIFMQIFVTYQMFSTTTMKHSNLLFPKPGKTMKVVTGEWCNSFWMYLFRTIYKPWYQGVSRLTFSKHKILHYWFSQNTPSVEAGPPQADQTWVCVHSFSGGQPLTAALSSPRRLSSGLGGVW